MAYTYLDLVNEINRKLNEVELTSSNFAGAIGFYSTAKDAINVGIRRILNQDFEWPFTHILNEFTLSKGDCRYSFPADLKTADMDTFRIKRNASLGVETRRLKLLSYEDFLDRFADVEYNPAIKGVPEFVARTQNSGFILYPTPDDDYELVYEYYTYSEDLELPEDVPIIPKQYKNVIINGAMVHCYMFRGDEVNATLSDNLFTQGLKDMRTVMVNRYEYVRPTTIVRHGY